MGQIHVAFAFNAGAGVSDLAGLPAGTGDAAGDGETPTAGKAVFVVGFDRSVTLGDDFIHPP